MIKLSLPVPPSSNNMFLNRKGRGRIRTPEYDAWIADSLSRISSDKFRLGFYRVPSPVSVLVRVGKIAVASDLSNRIKAAEDILVKSGLIENDSVNHVHRITAEKAFGDVREGWIEITVTRATDVAA